MVSMGFQFGLEGESLCPKRRNRWLLKIDGVSADDTEGVSVLPPLKSERPTIKFKESQVKHLIEDVYYPAKPDWQPIKLTLYDLKTGVHPVFEWIKIFYDPQQGTLYEPNRSLGGFSGRNKFITNARLELYNGCGDLLERWVFEDVWPEVVDFQDLDMANSDYLTCELTLRYARAYIQD